MSRQIARTQDGYIFFQRNDGSYADDEDEKFVDMTFDDDDHIIEFGGEIMTIGDKCCLPLIHTFQSVARALEQAIEAKEGYYTNDSPIVRELLQSDDVYLTLLKYIPRAEHRKAFVKLCPPDGMSATEVWESLAYLVEYMRFHTAESGDWNKLLPEYDSVLKRCEATLKRVL